MNSYGNSVFHCWPRMYRLLLLMEHARVQSSSFFVIDSHFLTFMYVYCIPFSAALWKRLGTLTPFQIDQQWRRFSLALVLFSGRPRNPRVLLPAPQWVILFFVLSCAIWCVCACVCVCVYVCWVGWVCTSRDNQRFQPHFTGPLGSNGPQCDYELDYLIKSQSHLFCQLIFGYTFFSPLVRLFEPLRCHHW